jgi:ribonuclease Z
VYSYESDFTIIASEIYPDGSGLSSEFHCLHGFKPENTVARRFMGSLIHEEEGLTVRVAVLDHKIASLAFSLEERLHVNIMKNRLDGMGLTVGPWLKELKLAIMRGDADDTQIRATRGGGSGEDGTRLSLKELREQAVRVEAGQKICYVTDTAFTSDNAERIAILAKGADYLFIEAAFPEAEAGRAAERCHLTARQAGELARRAGAIRVIPFHFSPRYSGREQELREEVEQAWQGG